MKYTGKLRSAMAALFVVLLISGCGDAASAVSKESAVQEKSSVAADTNRQQSTASGQPEKRKGDMDLKQTTLKITVNGRTLTAKLEDNATTRAFIEKLPTSLKMENLYGREMCYRYGKGGLAESATRSDRYEVGDIIYWPPRGSFVILYKQNGEEFERVQIGHIDGDVSLFDGSGDMEVSFSLTE